MKDKIIAIVLTIGKLILNFIYLFMKLLPTKKRITFLSRQSNNKTLDFELLEQELIKNDSNIDIVFLCKKIEKGIKSKIYYIGYLLKSMYFIATSKVCVIDGYSIPISILKHKKDLIIIQIWHASGAIKKFGYQILGKEEGSNLKIAKLMCMHKNYTYVIAPSDTTKEIYSEAFNIAKEKILIMGMPRLDYIQNDNEKLKQEFYNQYPELKNKKNILYIPTFRKGSNINLEGINKCNLDYNKYNIIIRLHPLDTTNVDKKYLVDNKYNTYDLLNICDYIITDYSATLIEASILEKPIFLYLYDFDNYKNVRGLNINLKEELDTFIGNDFINIANKIENNEYDISQIKEFKNKYIQVQENNTEKLAKFIINLI